MSSGPFFVVGTAKAGTTTIHRFLSAQPQVELSTPKETWYFDGPSFSSANPREDFLKRHIPRFREAEVYGEVATSYLFAPHALGRIKEAFPEAKIIAILRAPVDRAFSDWWMLYSGGFERLDFAAAVEENLARLNEGFSFEGDEGRAFWWSHLESLKLHRRVLYQTYVDYGHYDVQLERLYSIFPSSKIRVFFFEDLFSSSDPYVRVFCENLGIPLNSWPPMMHANPAFRSRSIRRLADAVAQSPIRRILPEQARAMVIRRLSKVGSRPKLGDSIRARLDKHYEPHIRQLESITGRDLSSWRAAGL